jgi:hypothetical protein
METTNNATEIQEQTRTVMKAYHVKYPNSTQFMAYPDVKFLIEHCNNDAGFIEKTIMGLADKTSKGEIPGFKWVSTAVMNEFKEKLTPKIQLTQEEMLDRCEFTAHQQVMLNEWKLPEGLTLNGFDENMKTVFDYLLETEQIGEDEYRLGILGIAIMEGKVDTEGKLHFSETVVKNDGIPF